MHSKSIDTIQIRVLKWNVRCVQWKRHTVIASHESCAHIHTMSREKSEQIHLVPWARRRYPNEISNTIIKSNPRKYHTELLNENCMHTRKFTFYRSTFYINYTQSFRATTGWYVSFIFFSVNSAKKSKKMRKKICSWNVKHERYEWTRTNKKKNKIRKKKQIPIRTTMNKRLNERKIQRQWQRQRGNARIEVK